MSVWSRLGARFVLRGATAVGHGVQVHGRLAIETLGTLRIGDEVQLGGAAAWTHLVTAVGATIDIGARTRIGHGSGIAATRSVTIGANVSIGPFSLLLDNDYHTVGDFSAVPKSSSVRIEDGARIGANVVVLPGAHIGAGATIPTGSVVAGKVPAGSTFSAGRAREVARTPAIGSMDGDHALALPADDLDVRQALARVLAFDGVPEEHLALESLAGWDSLGTLNVLLLLEERYGVALATEQMLRLRTVGDVVALVCNTETARHVPEVARGW